MPSRHLRVWTLLFAVALPAPCAFAAHGLTATQIARRNSQVMKVQDMQNQAKLTLVNADGQTRVREIRMLSKLQSNRVDSSSLIRFLAPADVKGTGVLTREHAAGDDDVWLYLPALKKSRRIVAAAKGQSFMGTEFSYTDIKTPRVDDFKYTLLKPQSGEAKSEYYLVQSVPASAAVLEETGYAKTIAWVRKDNFVDMRVDYYDKQGKLLKTMTSSDLVNIDPANHKWLALRKEMTNHQTKKSTVVELSDVKVNTGVPDETFTMSYLER